MRVAPQAVFLSYASQDADAARKITEALPPSPSLRRTGRGAGVEVWFDRSEPLGRLEALSLSNGLRGGDAWDAKIRKQIKECALFVPIISASTQARHEGYFRLEWKLAAERTHMMSGAIAFLWPVVIDDTRDTDAHVPAEFRAVQWTRLPAGETPTAFCARVKKLMNAGEPGAERLPVLDRAVNRRAPRRHRRLAPALLGVGLLIGAIAFWQPWRLKHTSSASPEASQLAERAYGMTKALNFSSEDLAVADELARKAITLEPDYARAWGCAHGCTRRQSIEDGTGPRSGVTTRRPSRSGHSHSIVRSRMG